MTDHQWKLLCQVLRVILGFLIDQREGFKFTPSKATWERNNQLLKDLDAEYQ